MSDVSLSKAVRANLLSLQNTAQMMDKTQSRLATGNKVNSALDNPSSFFTASALNSRAADMNNLLDSMASGVKVIEAANNGITSLTKNVESMQSTLRQARQDKSFQTQTFDVTKDSTLKVNGGQFGSETEIKLQTQDAGTAAAVTTTGTYNGATIDATKEGVGARSVITFDSAINNDKLTIDGFEITLATGDGAPEIATKLQAALGTDATGLAKKYTVTAGTATNGIGVGNVAIEAASPFSLAPKVEFGAGVVQATKASTSFKFDADTVGTMTAGGQTIASNGSFEDFVKALEDKSAAGGYTVKSDATTKEITLTSTDYAGATGPTVTGVPTYSATAKAEFTAGVGNNGDKITIDGIELTIGDNTGAAFADADATATAIRAAINANTTLSNRYTVAGTNDDVTLTAKAAGSQGTPKISTTDFPMTGLLAQDGGTGTRNTPGVAGASVRTVEAGADKINVNYGDKSAKIELYGMVKAGATPTTAEIDTYRADTIKNVNEQLKAQGFDDLEAKFDADGKFQIVAKNPEGKTLAISGDDASQNFGGNTVSTGKAAVSGYNATNTVDQFVEEINRSQAGKLRASNDNGKLRIENLSTQKLDVSFDKDGAGAGAPTSHEVAGNNVRANLAKQFNELRDQLDKFSDDASFNGINLLRGDKLTITFNESGSSSIAVQAKDANGNVRGINAANLGIDSLVAEDLDTDEAIDAYLTKLQGALGELRSQASTFGSNLSSVENRQSFTKNMINTLETGAANLTLADTNAEAANLLALQTRQQLSSSALSMASQQDQAVLQLLR